MPSDLSAGGSAAADPQAHLQVFFDCQLRKDLAPLRYVSDPEAGPRFRRFRTKIAIVETDLARRCGQEAHDALEQCGLAHPVVSHEARARSRRHIQFYVAQGSAVGVEL